MEICRSRFLNVFTLKILLKYYKTLFTVYLANDFIIQKGKNIVKRFVDNVLFHFVFYTNAVSQPVFCTDLFIEILLFGIFILFFLFYL